MSTSNAGLVIVLGTLCVGLACDVAEAQSASELKSDRLSLTDQRGTNRVNIGLSGGNQEFTYFYMNDNSGRKRVEFTVYPDERAPTLTFFDLKGRPIQARAQNSERPRANFSDIRPRVNGRYQDSGGGDKADSVQQLRTPVNPSGDVRSWLNAHNSGLLRIIQSRFDDQNMSSFATAERQRCSGNVYCELAYRQQAISILVSR